jgi:hypothetical protein
MKFPNHLNDLKNHLHNFREKMQTDYRKAKNSLYKIAKLAVLMI